MPATARERLKSKLSPRAIDEIRLFQRKVFHAYWVVTSPFVRRAQKVQEFPSGRNSELARLLGGIDVFVRTEMCDVMTRYGSDKGGIFHNYTTVYTALFGNLRDQPLRILEVGLGTNNPDLVSSMGASGKPGASLRGWRDLFPHASIFGADIDRDILFEEDRIKTYYCDQLDSAAVRDLWSQPALQGGMDIIIDDGLHTFEGNTSFLDGSLEQLRPGGIYVVEDIQNDTLDRWRKELETNYSKKYPNREFVLIELPNSRNPFDNNLLIIR